MSIIDGGFETLLPIPIERICDGAKVAELKLCIVVGVRADGGLYFASSDGDRFMVLWQLERAKKLLMKHVND